jgi:predicted Zn-dependent peptidase
MKKRLNICENVNFNYIKRNKFKTARIAVNFFIPLENDVTSSGFAVLADLLKNGCAKYPSFSTLNRRLEELCGASLASGTDKIGDWQSFGLSVCAIDERYSVGGEVILPKLADLLLEIIFDPDFDAEGFFKKEPFEQSKRQVGEDIDAELSDKRFFALMNCEKMVYAGSNAALSSNGSHDGLALLTPEKMRTFYEKMISDSLIEITMVSSSDFTFVYEKFKEKFKRSEIVSKKFENKSLSGKPMEIKEKLEKMDVAQCKLVLGFVAGIAEPCDDVFAMGLLCAVFGGTPTSKLFLNVREKLNLCYYCSCSYDRFTGAIFVESGVETANIGAAKDEILRQLYEVKAGNITEEEISNAKKAMARSYKSIDDNVCRTEIWYTFRAVSGRNESPDDISTKVYAVTKEQLVDAAQGIWLDSVYVLAGSEE